MRTDPSAPGPPGVVFSHREGAARPLLPGPGSKWLSLTDDQIFPGQECLTVRFDDKLATYTFDMLNELELAYAMTVHKAQGSEFDAVVVALSNGTSPRLLTRPILYTAITRARRLLVIVGSDGVIETMVNTNIRNRRYSALRARLRREES